MIYLLSCFAYHFETFGCTANLPIKKRGFVNFRISRFLIMMVGDWKATNDMSFIKKGGTKEKFLLFAYLFVNTEI